MRWQTKLMAAAVAGMCACAGCQTGKAPRGGDSPFLNGDPFGDAGSAASPATTTVAAAAEKAPARVSIDNFSFSPAELTVVKGTQVIWVNHDDVPHTVVGKAREFSSGTLDTNDQFARVFMVAGTYSYFCGVHPHMTGQIVVK
jgi:plastocyanin